MGMSRLGVGTMPNGGKVFEECTDPLSTPGVLCARRLERADAHRGEESLK